MNRRKYRRHGKFNTSLDRRRRWRAFWEKHMKKWEDYLWAELDRYDPLDDIHFQREAANYHDVVLDEGMFVNHLEVVNRHG